MKSDHQRQLLVCQKNLLFGPVLHVVVSKFEIKTPENFGQDEFHLS